MIRNDKKSGKNVVWKSVSITTITDSMLTWPLNRSDLDLKLRFKKGFLKKLFQKFYNKWGRS